MKFLALILVYLLTISGCVSAYTKKNDLQSFDKGLQLMYAGDTFKAKKLWQILCDQENQDLACWGTGKRLAIKPGLAIMQGATDETSIQLVILAQKRSNLRLYLRDPKSGKFVKENKRRESSQSHSDKAIIQVRYDNLKPGIDYVLVAASDQGELVDQRIVQTLKASGDNLRFAITSCMDDSYMKVQESQWEDLTSLQPEVLFMIGDNVYIDMGLKKLTKNVTPELIWDRYVETRQRLKIFRKERLIPVFATWDDHDYGINNGGRQFPHKEISKNIFNEFFPQEENSVILSKGPGVAEFLRLRGQNFVLLDDRTFRSPAEEKKGQVHFGENQELWMHEQLKKYKGPFWLISGDQFFGGYHPHESYQGNHPAAFAHFLRDLKKVNRRVVFVSGDRHLTEIMEIPAKSLGYKTYELTSSGIHATVFPGSLSRWKNPLDIEGVDGVMNYMIVEGTAFGRGLDMDVTAYGPDKKILFQRRLKVR